MSDDAARVFRLDNDALPFRFTATLSYRTGKPRERLTSPARLRLWLDAAGLAPRRDVTDDEFATAIGLREAIYRLGVAAAHGTGQAPGDIALLNAAAANGTPVAALGDGGSTWILRNDHPVRDGLAVIAQDTILTLGTDRAARIKTCDGADCAGLFLDTSRGNNRRWCSMNTCGNRAKKSRMAIR
ncbi:MAG: CGNR zinc finger domain-containing protein [Gordonia sp. (in: high G+C Gram-positive bacteria)]